MRRSYLWGVSLGMLVAAPLSAGVRTPTSGTLQIQVVGAGGESNPDASVYIYGAGAEDRGDLRSGDVINLPEGTYTVAAAWMDETVLGVIPRVSPRAHVRVTAGDVASVILPLNSLLSRPKEAPAGPLVLSSR